MKNNQFKEFTTIEEMAKDLNMSLPSVDTLASRATKYCKDKRISHYCRGFVSGFEMITLVLKGKKSSNTLKQGYQLVYAYNMDCEDLSEMGDAYIIKKDDGFYYRAS